MIYFNTFKHEIQNPNYFLVIFKYSALKDLLLANTEKPMEEQKLILSKTFDNWRGSLEQVDDVCVVGIKV